MLTSGFWSDLCVERPTSVKQKSYFTGKGSESLPGIPVKLRYKDSPQGMWQQCRFTGKIISHNAVLVSKIVKSHSVTCFLVSGSSSSLSRRHVDKPEVSLFLILRFSCGVPITVKLRTHLKTVFRSMEG